ncbi:glycosyltransferase family 2 protein [Chitinophaga arvensicola]|uniref:Glycosyl transferase family 2 n=1 Tax=Chitinophaga arvensicola TaxID=29529 RepID=A0A1I0NP41_9BACT|nr:glycosyltransferase [Chitinophaga arvensicola]SEW03226.1 Glycosyl transferase family 2 [Chitinophaga arvensicola]
MNNPRLSIVVAFYNVEKYLDACLSSVIDASIEDSEIIVVNDGSTDRSFEIATAFQQRYPDKIKVVNKEQGGMSDARNFGLAEARGEYIMFFDSDDLVMPGVINKMLHAAVESGADIAVADYYEFEDGSEQKRYRHDMAAFDEPLVSEEKRLIPLFKVEISYAIWNKLYKRSFLLSNGLTFLKGYWFEDLDFIFRAFYKAGKVIKVNELLYGYRQRPGSIMKSISRKILDKIDVMRKLGTYLKEEGKFRQYESWYNLLYVKMSLSVLYSSYKNMKDRELSMGIIKEVLDDPYFREITGSGLKEEHFLKKQEKILYRLIKYKIVNGFTLRTASLILK